VPDPTPTQGPFRPTRWTLVGRASDSDEDVRKTALNDLAECYMPAIRLYLRRRKGMSHDQADDTVQGFMSDKVIEQGIVGQANKERGKFRNFLLVSLNRYLISRVRRDQAKKRSPETAAASLDADPDSAAGPDQPDSIFEIEWARKLLADATARMKEQCEGSKRQSMWNVFENRILRPAMEDAPAMEYEQLASRFGFKSTKEVQNLLVNAKRRFVNCLREAIMEHEGTNAQIDVEIADMQKILSRFGS
jgi:DNA-directed RNA polymerase specialized sigma24 family protein